MKYKQEKIDEKILLLTYPRHEVKIKPEQPTYDNFNFHIHG